MPWLFLLLALGAVVIAFTTTSVPLAAIALLLSLVFVVIGVMGLLAQRVGSQSRSEAMMVDPVELRRLREQADARRAGAVSATAPAPVAPDNPARPPSPGP
ncbi:hypothetical protein [Luteimonas terrae]|uniref:Uncharacterized protein n=1 Tax=Luteimonas terrae TaxID=1530191 RepID=A0A4R5U5E5_9GAMM|nr:hypothetical protein [Luteimonas terrae]KPN16943.1 hypothetical protein AO715_02315 [Xanthomonas sp. Mitacek01]TDK29109.1 hypothetical protein E2F49_15230 [Luteimonas terrae]